MGSVCGCEENSSQREENTLLNAKLLDLRVLDHVVIGNGTGAWVSMAERGQM